MLEPNRISGPRMPAHREEARLPGMPMADFGYDVGIADNDGADRFDPVKLLLYVVQYRWLILTLLVIGLATGTVITFMQSPKYMASAQLEIMPATAKVMADLDVIDQSSESRSFETARQRLMSRDVAQRVVSALNLAQNPQFLFPRADFSIFNVFARVFGVTATPSIDSLGARQREARATAEVQRGVSVDIVRNTSILSVNYSSTSPQFAAQVANQLVKSYMDQQVDQTVSTSNLARQFVQQAVDDSKQKLADSEQALVDYAKKEGITADSDGSLITANINAINTSLAQAVQDRLAVERVIQQINAGQGAFIDKVVNNAGVQRDQTQLQDLKAQYQDKLKTYKADYPDMVNLAAQIQEQQAQLNSQIAAIVASVQLDYQNAQNKEKDLNAKLADFEAQQVAFQDKNIQYTILSREVDSNRTQYKSLVDKLNSLGVSDLKQSNVSVVDDAEVPGAPYSPRILANIGLWLGIAAGLSVAIIYIQELLNNKFNRPDQIESDLKLAVLGIIPKVEHGKLDEALGDAKSALAEAYRSLRTSLQFAGAEGAPRILTITSAEPGESKSTTAFKLAEEFGAIGIRVLIVDTDMRRPSLHRLFKADNTVGLTNLLTGTVTDRDIASVFQSTDFPNVTFLPSGPLVPNPADLLSSHRMAGILHACAKTYDLIMLDGPPVIGLSDAPILARLAEATLMVISAHQVSRRSARAALKRLRSTGGHVVGATLCKFAIDRVEYSYAYRYMNDGYYAYGAETPVVEDKRSANGVAGVKGRALSTGRRVVGGLARRLSGPGKRNRPAS